MGTIFEKDRVKTEEKDLLLNTFEHRWMAGWFQISRGALLKIRQADRVNAEVAPSGWVAYYGSAKVECGRLVHQVHSTAWTEGVPI